MNSHLNFNNLNELTYHLNRRNIIMIILTEIGQDMIIQTQEIIIVPNQITQRQR